MSQNPSMENREERAHSQDYQPPEIRILSEEEVLTAFQVTAAGTTAWWTK